MTEGLAVNAEAFTALQAENVALREALAEAVAFAARLRVVLTCGKCGKPSDVSPCDTCCPRCAICGEPGGEDGLVRIDASDDDDEIVHRRCWTREFMRRCKPYDQTEQIRRGRC